MSAFFIVWDLSDLSHSLEVCLRVSDWFKELCVLPQSLQVCKEELLIAIIEIAVQSETFLVSQVAPEVATSILSWTTCVGLSVDDRRDRDGIHVFYYKGIRVSHLSLLNGVIAEILLHWGLRLVELSGHITLLLMVHFLSNPKELHGVIDSVEMHWVHEMPVLF
jgi:hypothetical protein